MGEPLSSDRVFDFLVDEPEPHPAYGFFAPKPLPGYDGNPNNNNRWLEADDYLLRKLEAMVDEPMVVPAIEEVAEPVAEAEEEQVIALVVDMEEEQMDALVIDMEEGLAALFGDDDFEDDASDGFNEEEVWEVNEEWLMSPTTPPSVLAMPPPSVYEVSDAEVAAGVSIGEIGPRVFVVEGQVQVIASQMVHAADRWEQALQAAVQQRDTQIQQLQTTVLEMDSRESTLIRCILGLERRLAALEPPGPQ
ncbi:hypothetical protein Tco_0587988 [Tanacetum coccineum]